MRKTVLITGGAQRVGAALSRFFAQNGWNVVIHYNRSSDVARELSKELSGIYPEQYFPVVWCNLSEFPEKMIEFFNHLPQELNSIDVLINNASVFDPGVLSDTTPELLKSQMSVNFEAPLFLMQSFVNCFKSGVIVNVIDTRVTENSFSHAAYSISKKALMHLTKMAALEWAPDVRVNAVAPGPVLPPPGKTDDYLHAVIKETPLKKQVKLDNLSESVYFLVENDSITGQIIFCDSGTHLT
ncbi:SDR family NAD(P)-dependent oxidoreductase [Alkalitalea saponilacus]|uniref:NAD(P)-dependent dehydrogenase, short-chain alcohol dehydrogenase family n=1 Tax=Alkalitalea saponilacus TaxID=889453 RepID=A0A1T5HL36_9BACT|nr:SDR family NAD(P)-dependent oxidoreductase [Alkalitalea saponilacus]ASB47789.1 short-chain dehydrogenase [Alkalitalea saponilacus]SKC21261.1 NAD(P)-dependent dehydrogenase, short-chain alcohol dehydrogenase family [Alkalitalea saponilacus]